MHIMHILGVRSTLNYLVTHVLYIGYSLLYITMSIIIADCSYKKFTGGHAVTYLHGCFSVFYIVHF